MATSRPEKKLANLPVIRVPETLERQLQRSAGAEDRTLSEYCRLILWRHEFGHARMVGDRGEAVTDFGALHGDADE